MPTLQSQHVRLDVEGEKDRVQDQAKKKKKHFRPMSSQETFHCYILIGSGVDGGAAAPA